MRQAFPFGNEERKVNSSHSYGRGPELEIMASQNSDVRRQVRNDHLTVDWGHNICANKAKGYAQKTSHTCEGIDLSNESVISQKSSM